MFLRTIPAALGLLIFSVSVSADEKIDHVLKVAQMHAKVSACGTSFDDDAENKTTAKDIYLIDDGDYQKKYIVSWSGDLGCAGGSGTFGQVFTEISSANTAEYKYVVMNDDAFGMYGTNDNFMFNVRFVELVKQLSKDKFEIVSSGFSSEQCGESKMNNFPSTKYKYTISKDGRYNWRLESKVFLSCNNK
ncbi:hypothetical protein [Pectobacterium peruviense]|uniref:hypothetical protein n=1 Tax=Pectobacterium peruviense TaxID=2066479 RepID=UPI000DE3FE61|nr:hypothetical protein [Pectobacterium peruviense]